MTGASGRHGDDSDDSLASAQAGPGLGLGSDASAMILAVVIERRGGPGSGRRPRPGPGQLQTTVTTPGGRPSCVRSDSEWPVPMGCGISAGRCPPAIQVRLGSSLIGPGRARPDGVTTRWSRFTESRTAAMVRPTRSRGERWRECRRPDSRAGRISDFGPAGSSAQPDSRAGRPARATRNSGSADAVAAVAAGRSRGDVGPAAGEGRGPALAWRHRAGSESGRERRGGGIRG